MLDGIIFQIKTTLFLPIGSETGPLGIVFILEGMKNTVIISLFAIILGLIIGLVISLLNISGIKILKLIALLYVEIIRGTPVLVQLMFIYLVILVNLESKIIVAIIAFGVNSGAYVSEVIRAGLAAVDKGQMEASRSLGMSYFTSMRYIIVPQGIKNILPALVSSFAALIKDSSVIGFIGGFDLMRSANIISSQTFFAVVPLTTVAIIYLAITLSVVQLGYFLERKLKRND